MARNKQYKSKTGLSTFVSRLEACKPAYILLGLFVIAVAIRFLLALLSSDGPIIYIDEGLYINVARGLAGSGEVTYRDQPTSYLYLLYPITLLPMFLLPTSVDLYRAVQLWNIVIMTSAIIPGYLLARRLKLSRAWSYVAVVFLLVMPDMILSSFMIAECLLYPLMLWLFYVAFRMGEGDKPLLMGGLVALISALLYFTKPGNIAFGIVFLVLMAIWGIRQRDWKRVGTACLAGACMALLVAGGYLLYNASFDRITSVLSLYKKQIPTLSLHNILGALQSSILHMLLFVFAGVCFIPILPIIERKAFLPNQRLMLDAIALSVVVGAVGTAVMVTLYEWEGTWLNCRVHLRYLMYYMPVLFMYVLSIANKEGKLQRKGLIACGICMALFIFPSAFAGFTAGSASVDSMALSAFFEHVLGKTTGIALIIGTVAFLIPFLWMLYKKGWSQAARRAMLVAVPVFMLVNNATGYEARNRDLDPMIGTEANELVQLVGDEEFLFITNNHYDDFRGYQLDVRLRKPTKFVVSNNILLDATATGGTYRPFIPLVQAPNIANEETPNTTLLVTDVTVADYLELTDNVQRETTKNGYYTLLRIQEGEPWLKTAIASMEGYVLWANAEGSLVVYDEGLLERGSVTLHINMRATDGATSVRFTAGEAQQSINVTPEFAWYEVELPVHAAGMRNITFTCDQNLIVAEYWTE